MIICAAIKLFDIGVNRQDVIIAGMRHSDCYETAFQLSPIETGLARDEDRIIEGFITDSPYTKFLDKTDAYLHARIVRQLSPRVVALKEEKGEKELYSEDLY